MNERTADDRRIPDNERWLHTSKAATALEEALDWAGAHPPSDAQADEVVQRLRDGAP